MSAKPSRFFGSPGVEVKIRLPDDVFLDLAKAAERAGQELPVYLAERLGPKEARPPTSTALVFRDEERRDLERILGRNLANSAEALQAVRQALSARIDDVTVPIRPALLHRLKARALRRPFPEFVARTVGEELERFCQMR